MFMDTMRTSPEWRELWESLREMGVDVDHYMELFEEFYRLAWRGTLFSDWKSNKNSLCFVLTCIKFHYAQ